MSPRLPVDVGSPTPKTALSRQDIAPEFRSFRAEARRGGEAREIGLRRRGRSRRLKQTDAGFGGRRRCSKAAFFEALCQLGAGYCNNNAAIREVPDILHTGVKGNSLLFLMM
jgi:hypothetical protein